MKAVQKSFLVLAAALMLLISGCSSISSGTITTKSYSPESTITTISCSGTPSVCMPQVQYYPAVWTLNIVNEDQSGEIVQGWVHVSEEVYNAYNEGDYYEASK